MGDETGAVTIDPAAARFFDFDFVHEGVDLGRVSISLNELGSLKIYYSQGITENQDDLSKRLWFNFLKEMRMFAMRRLLRFDTRDISKSNLDKNDFQYLASKEKKESVKDLAERSFRVSDFKVDVFESISEFRKWMRSPKSNSRGMTRYAVDRYENIVINDVKLLESNSDFSLKKQEAKVFSDKFKQLDQRDHVEIKIGNKIAILSSTVVPSDSDSRIELSGFTTPKEIVKINLDYQNKIDSIEFDDGGRFPESSEFTSVGGTSITNTVFFNDKQSASKALTTIWLWINLLEGKGWSIENFMSNESANINKDDEMKKISESRWNHRSTKKTSRAVKGQTEVIVRHNRPVDETYPGSRSQQKNIKAIFIQNRDGERFKYPFIHPAGAFAMAQHVDHGGVPHDPAGKAIMRMSEEIAQLQAFHRKVQHSQLHDDAMGITERAVHKLQELKAKINNLSKRHHYESWIAEFNETEDMGVSELDQTALEDYKSKFTETNFKEDLVDFFPLLDRIMKEANRIDLEDYVEEGHEVVPSIDRERYTDMSDQGLEGPFRLKSGKVVYYDPKAGQYYDRDTDMYLSHDEYDQYQKEEQDPMAEFESWAEAVEQGKLTDDQIKDLKAALDSQQVPQDLDTAFNFFNEFGIDDSDLEDKFRQAAELDQATDPMEVFQLWAQENYPELLVALGMSGTQAPEAPETPEEPTAENDEAGGMPNKTMPTRENVVKEVARIVKSFYNRDNPDVGPFRGEEGIVIDVEKQVSEMFGEKAGHQARQLAEKFIEKLTNEWSERHGREAGSVDHDDGLARLKELLGNVKKKVEGIGDQGVSGRDFNKNIMPAEELEEPDMQEGYREYDALRDKIEQILIKTYEKYGTRDEILDVAKPMAQKVAQNMGLEKYFDEIWSNALASHDVDTNFGDNDDDFDRTDYSMRQGELGNPDRMREGKIADKLKAAGKKVLDKLGHGDDDAMIKDLQKKVGMPQTGKKPMATTNEVSDDELNARPGMWRGDAKRMTVKGKPTKDELGMQANLKNRIKASNKKGGLTGPKGVLPEQGVAEGSEERGQNRLWQMITDYEQRAKATKNDIKKAHYLKMASELRGKLKTSDKQGVAEGSGNMWEVSFDYGPHMSRSVTVKANSKESAIKKVLAMAKKQGLSPMINWAKPAEQGVAEGSDEFERILKLSGLAK